MGGSGGRGRSLPSFDPEEFRDRIRKAEDERRDETYEFAVAGFLAECLAQFNDRDTAAIQRILDSVKIELSEEFEEPVSLLFGGSVAKHTYVDGLSDIDALLLMNPKDVSDETPDAMRELCAARLRERFGKENISVGNLAITLVKDGHTLQLLPALRSGEHFKIADSDGHTWAKIRPRDFANALSEANSRLSNKLVPTIKLAKAIIAQFPEPRRLTGYHVEALAVDIFKDYKGELTTKSMLRCFFEEAPARVISPIKDITGQSIYVDDYLQESNSIKRKIVADSCDRVARIIKNADGAHFLPMWKGIFGESI
jgi:hypothetical protein